MKQNFKTLFEQIEQTEDDFSLSTNRVIQDSLMMVTYLNGILQELKKTIVKESFQSSEEEVNFFRNIKPKIQGKLFYYNEVYRIETLRPVSIDGEITRKYFLEEEKRLRKKCNHFLKCSDFHRYYHSGSSEFDNKYFRRYQISYADGLDNHAFELDPDFSTYYDYMVARIICQELFYEYLLYRTSEHLEDALQEGYGVAMEWTANKSALIELIYALYACSCLTNGKVSINKIALIFQTLFKVQLGDIHNIFYRMKTRTGSRTLFIDELKESLEDYMNKKL